MTDTNGAVDPSVDGLPDTPAGRQIGWFLTHSLTRGKDLTADDVASHMAFGPPWTPEDGLARFHEANDQPFRIAKVRVDEPHTIELLLDYGDDRPWNATINVEPQPPHRITRTFWSRAIPEDITIRPATASDGPGLNELEVQAPM